MSDSPGEHHALDWLFPEPDRKSAWERWPASAQAAAVVMMETPPTPGGEYADAGDYDENGERRATFLDRLRAAALDTDGLDSIPEPSPLIDGLLFTDTTVWTIGKAGHGKSFVALDQAGCIATGESWQGHTVIQGPVLYVIAEGSAGIRKRVRSWEKSYDRKMTGIMFLPVAVQAGQADQWHALIDYAQEIRPVFIILDTQARTTVGMEENSARDMGGFIHSLEQLRIATRACVMVVHHKGRSGDHMRGSTAMDGAGDTVVEVIKDGDVITVKNPKQKHVEEHEEITLRMTPFGESVVLMRAEGTFGANAAANKMAQRWWDTFRGDWVSANKLLAAEVAPSSTFYRNVHTLIDTCLVVKEERGRFSFYRLLGEPK